MTNSCDVRCCCDVWSAITSCERHTYLIWDNNTHTRTHTHTLTRRTGRHALTRRRKSSHAQTLAWDRHTDRKTDTHTLTHTHTDTLTLTPTQTHTHVTFVKFPLPEIDILTDRLTDVVLGLILVGFLLVFADFFDQPFEVFCCRDYCRYHFCEPDVKLDQQQLQRSLLFLRTVFYL